MNARHHRRARIRSKRRSATKSLQCFHTVLPVITRYLSQKDTVSLGLTCKGFSKWSQCLLNRCKDEICSQLDVDIDIDKLIELSGTETTLKTRRWIACSVFQGTKHFSLIQANTHGITGAYSLSYWVAEYRDAGFLIFYKQKFLLLRQRYANLL